MGWGNQGGWQEYGWGATASGGPPPFTPPAPFAYAWFAGGTTDWTALNGAIQFGDTDPADRSVWTTFVFGVAS